LVLSCNRTVLQQMAFSLTSLVVLAIVAVAVAPAPPITITSISSDFNHANGIVYYAPLNERLISVNFPFGVGGNFATLDTGGTATPFSSVSGLTDEVYMASVKRHGTGWPFGDVFTGSGADGQLTRIYNQGANVITNWCQIPTSCGVFRGGLTFDTTGLWGNNLLVTTTEGCVYKISYGFGACSASELIAEIGEFTEGITTVGNVAALGGWANKIIIANEQLDRLYTIDTAGTVVTYNVPIDQPESIHLIPENQNFYGIDYYTKKVLGIAASEWTPYVGKLVVPAETGDTWLVEWDLTLNEPVYTKFAPNPAGATAAQWEGGAFGEAGIVEIPPTCVAACGDPHFKGLDGKKYDFQGQVGKVFAMISDHVVEVNSEFIHRPGKASDAESTVLGATCIRLCDHTAVIYPNRSVIVDGFHTDKHSDVMAGPMRVTRFGEWGHIVQVEIPGRWTFQLAMYGERVDLDRAVPFVQWDDRTHGVLGHTLQGNADTTKCNSNKEGSCEVAGDWQDYIVHSHDICSPVWAHSFFSKKACL